MINFDEYSNIGTHWVALYVHNNYVTYFDSFGVGHIPKEIKAFINRPLSSALQNKNIITNISRIQAFDSIICGYFCIGFIDFMLAGKTLTEFTNLFSPKNVENRMSDLVSFATSDQLYFTVDPQR